MSARTREERTHRLHKILNAREIGTLLAALRLYHRHVRYPVRMTEGRDAPLDDSDIDDLCEDLNFGTTSIEP